MDYEGARLGAGLFGWDERPVKKEDWTVQVSLLRADA